MFLAHLPLSFIFFLLDILLVVHVRTVHCLTVMFSCLCVMMYYQNEMSYGNERSCFCIPGS